MKRNVKKTSVKQITTITLQPFYDKEFKNSLWGYNLKRFLKEAAVRLEKQFPNTKFIVRKPALWKSPGTLAFASLPYNLVYRLKKYHSVTGLIEGMIAETRKTLDIPIRLNKRLTRKAAKRAKKETGAGRVAHLMARVIEPKINSYIIRHLEKVVRKRHLGADIVIGFTGKLCSINGLGHSSKEIGFATVRRLRYAVVGAVHNPRRLILHELGHTLGAIHSMHKKSVMYREGITKPTYTFDSKNRKLIKQTLQVLRDKQNAAKK